jgi:hypothetical protein
MDIAYLTVSSDNYEPFWYPYYELLKINNNDVFTKKYHLSENLKTNVEGVINITTHLPLKAQSWSENLLIAIDTITEDYIVMMLEDFFITENLDKIKFNYCFEFIQNHHEIGCLRLAPKPAGDELYDHDQFQIHSDKQNYKISTQAAIWRKEFLKKIIQLGENPWEFELNGSKRAANFNEKVIVLQKNPYPINYFNAVIDGRLTKKALRFLKSKNIKLDMKRIKVNGIIQEFYWNTKNRKIRSLIDFINYRIMPIKKL